jgi:hypothetical protein
MMAFETQTSCRPGPLNTSCALESIQFCLATLLPHGDYGIEQLNYFRIGHLNKVFLLTLINFNLI